jgi:hypothetical protein
LLKSKMAGRKVKCHCCHVSREINTKHQTQTPNTQTTTNSILHRPLGSTFVASISPVFAVRRHIIVVAAALPLPSIAIDFRHRLILSSSSNFLLLPPRVIVYPSAAASHEYTRIRDIILIIYKWLLRHHSSHDES